MSSPEDLQKYREGNEPSNLDVISAFACSERLELFHVGNKAQDKLYILASSRRNAQIIATMGGHIRRTANATFWKPTPEIKPGSALAQAVRAGMPGVIWLGADHVITRDHVFYDASRKG